jgi:thiamine biosynthesis lipoprotein
MKRSSKEGTAMPEELEGNRLHHIRFRAMNTQIQAILADSRKEDAQSLDVLVRNWFGRQEERFSRFLPDSELTHLNNLAGEICLVSGDMLEVVMLSETYRQETGGLFNPLVMNALQEAGYDATFDDVKWREDFRSEAQPPRHPSRSLQPIAADPVMKSIKLPVRTAMDLGGIVKGWTVGRLSAYLQTKLGLSRGLVNAGGDLAVWGGASEQGEPWIIGIESPWAPEADAGFIALSDGSAATSSTLGRRWQTSVGTAHHLIDPRTMRPGGSDVVQCTVAGPDTVRCEIWAKALCIAGSEEGAARFARLSPWGYEAMLFTEEGSTVFVGSEASVGRRWLNITPDRIYRPPVA